MAEHQMHRILEDLERRLPLLRIVVIHRTGRVPAGEPSLYVRVESAHRREAFVACQSFIDQMKRDVPIWKHPEQA
jgi:molybdopterin synthase catalytic subunit